MKFSKPRHPLIPHTDLSSPGPKNLKLTTTTTPRMVVSYRECLKNHAASFGGHALDGCGEFIPSLASPLACDACGCHRNFHRREPQKPSLCLSPSPGASPPGSRSPTPSPISASPAPYSYYAAAAPHVLMALSAAGISGHLDESRMLDHRRLRPDPTGAPNRIRRTRTRFSQDQKAKMRDFAEKLGWRINGRDDKEVKQFCDEVGVDRTVLKVWMHNNKPTCGKREKYGTTNNGLIIDIVKSCKNEEDELRGSANGSGSSS